MSGKMTKFKDLLVDTPNRYTVNGEVKTIVFAPNTITQEGTKDKAEYFNEMQKNGLYNVNATRLVEGTVEFYDVSIDGSDIFDVFNTQFIINFNETNTKLNPVLRFNNNNYYIRMIESFIDVDVEIGTLQKTYIGFLDSANNKLKLFRNEKKLTFDTVADLQTATWLVDGDTIQLLGYYTENDGAGHKLKKNPIGSPFGYEVISAIELGYFDLKWLGAKHDGTFDNKKIFDNAKILANNYGVPIKFSGTGTYYIGTSRPDLTGVKIMADSNTVIKVDENPNTKDLQLLTPITILNHVHGTQLIKPQNTNLLNLELMNIASAIKDFSLYEEISIIDMTTWVNKIYQASTNDIETLSGTGTLTSDNLIWSSDFSGAPQVFYPSTTENKSLYEINCSNNGGVNEEIGVFIKDNNGHIFYVSFIVGLGTLKIVEFFNGSVLQNYRKLLPNGGAYGFISNQEINLGFYVDGLDIVVLSAGLPVFRLKNFSKVGFYISNTGDATKLTFKDLIETKNYTPKLKKITDIAVVGDSISYGAWDSLSIEDILPIMLKNLKDFGKVSIDNFAVSGTTSLYWTTHVPDLTGKDFCLVMLGTNDQQGNASVDSYISNIENIANQIKTYDCIPIFGIFPIFTNSTQSRVTGVTTTNYAYHAKYTHALKKFCIENGYEFADIRRNFQNNLSWYGDNIHPTVEGQIAVCSAWCEALSRYMLKNNTFY